MNLPIDEIVGFLIDHNPGKLTTLIQQYGLESSPHFQRGNKLGETRDDERGLRQAKCEAAVIALEEVTQLVPGLINKVLGQISRANRWESAGAVIGVFGSAGAIAALWPQQPDELYAKLTAGIALVGSLCTLAFKTNRKTLLGKQDNIAEDLTQIQENTAKGEQILPILRYAIAKPDALGLEEIAKSITDANDLVRQMRKQIFILS